MQHKTIILSFKNGSVVEFKCDDAEISFFDDYVVLYGVVLTNEVTIDAAMFDVYNLDSATIRDKKESVEYRF